MRDDAAQHCHIPSTIIASSTPAATRKASLYGHPLRPTPARAPHDRRGHRRRQERVPGRADQPARGERRARPGRVRHHGAGLRRLPRPQPAHREDRRGARQGERGRRGRARQGRGGHPRHGREGGAAARARTADPGSVRRRGPGRCAGELRRALLRHRRGPARRLLRGPAGDLPQHPRRRARARGREARLRLALQRPRHRLPRAQGLQACRGVDLRGRAAHGAQRPRRRGRHVHHGHRVGLPRGGVHHLELRPGRDGGAGRGEPGRVLRLEAMPRARASPRSCAAASAARPSRWCSTPRPRRASR